MPVLVGISADYLGKTFELKDDEISVGRTDANTIPLNNASISSQHCVLRKRENGYLLKDLDSTNGTRVNGQQITETMLQDRDVVHFGALEFIYADQQAENVDVDALTTQIINPTTVEVSTDPAARPASFSNVSPFSAPKKDSRGTWAFLIAVIGALALACVGLLFYLLFFKK